MKGWVMPMCGEKPLQEAGKTGSWEAEATSPSVKSKRKNLKLTLGPCLKKKFRPNGVLL